MVLGDAVMGAIYANALSLQNVIEGVVLIQHITRGVEMSMINHPYKRRVVGTM